MAWNHLKLCKNDRVCLLSWKKSFWASQTHFLEFSEFHPCVSPNQWFGIWGSLVWNYVTCQNSLKSLETLQKWSRVPSFMKEIILSQSNSFFGVFRISPLSKSQSMIWYLGKSAVKVWLAQNDFFHERRHTRSFLQSFKWFQAILTSYHISQ